jgi:predicted O-methyltransferase YrrM
MQDHLNLGEPSALTAILRDTHAMHFNMASEPLGFSLLSSLAASKPTGNLLEIGSGTGLSTA